MATPASERIPDLNLAMMDQDILIGYDDAAPLRDLATGDFYGALYTRRVRHADGISVCAGNIIFSSLGEVGTSFETPYMSYGTRVIHQADPDGWRFSFSIGTAMESERDKRTQTFYRIGTANRAITFAGKAVREVSPALEIHIVDEFPLEEENPSWTLDIEPLRPEDCVEVLEVMKRVMRRAKVQKPRKATPVKCAVRALELTDFNL